MTWLEVPGLAAGAGAVLCVLVASAGVALFAGPLARLHAVAAATVVAPWFAAAAVVVSAATASGAWKGGLALLIVVASSPALTHATAAAIELRQRSRREG